MLTVNDLALPTYEYRDVSRNTDRHNLVSGRSRPIGTLVHTTSGANSLD